MLSLTSDDMPNFTYASSEEMRGAQEKALNLWVGATLPLWAPFWLASAFGVGLWTLGQGFKRAQLALGTGPETAVGEAIQSSATDVAGTVQNMVDDGVIAPMKAAGQAIQDITTAVTPSPQALVDQIKSAGDAATAQAEDLGQAATSTVDKATERAVEQAEAQTDAAADVVADTGTLLTGGAAVLPKAATAVAADTAIAPADSDRPGLRKPGSKKS